MRLDMGAYVYLAPEDFLSDVARMERALRHADRRWVEDTVQFLKSVIACWRDNEECASRVGDEIGRARAMMVLEILGDLLFVAQSRLRNRE